MAAPFEPDDLFRYQTFTELECTTALEIAACTVQTISREQDNSGTSIWLVPLDGAAPRRFTSGPGDSSPRWAPSGSQLAFLSSAAAVVRFICCGLMAVRLSS